MPRRPLLSITITPKTAADTERLARALERLSADDAQVHVLRGATGHDVELGCMSEPHLILTLERLREECGVEAAVSRPKVLYREAVTRAADGEAKYAKQFIGGGEYGHVKVRIYPAEPGEGCSIENRIARGEIPDQFIPAVEAGIKQALADGGLAGYPIEDSRVEIYDGSYHDVDSTEGAFRIAAAQAVERAIKWAAPVLLEPVMCVEVAVPSEFEAQVLSNLVSRRGNIQSRIARGDTHVIHALVPLAELLGYHSDLRRRTLGSASFRLEFHSFMACDIAEDDDDRESAVGVPRRPRPKPPDSAIAVPEPEDHEE